MSLPPLPPTYATTRTELHRVAAHLVARARVQATGRFGLRVVGENPDLFRRVVTANTSLPTGKSASQPASKSADSIHLESTAPSAG